MWYRGGRAPSSSTAPPQLDTPRPSRRRPSAAPPPRVAARARAAGSGRPPTRRRTHTPKRSYAPLYEQSASFSHRASGQSTRPATRRARRPRPAPPSASTTATHRAGAVARRKARERLAARPARDGRDVDVRRRTRPRTRRRTRPRPRRGPSRRSVRRRRRPSVVRRRRVARGDGGCIVKQRDRRIRPPARQRMARQPITDIEEVTCPMAKLLNFRRKESRPLAA